MTTLSNSGFSVRSLSPDNRLREDDPFFHIGATLQFNYEGYTYAKFCQQYSEEGWIGRKVMAVPKVLYSVIIKTICHLAKAILLPISDFSKAKDIFKAYTFCFVRDLQESFGHLYTLFYDDKYGSYLIEQSVFQRKCYEFMVSDKKYNLRNGQELEENQGSPVFPTSDSSDSPHSVGYKEHRNNLKLLKNFFKESYLKLLSTMETRDLRKTNFSRLTRLQVNKLFYKYNFEKRFAELSAAQVLQIFDKLSDTQLKFITEEQLKDPMLKAKYENRTANGNTMFFMDRQTSRFN